MEEAFLTSYITIIALILGCVFGSFMNCAAWRIARGENWMTRRSHCALCNHPLSALDLIPVLSYLILRGRCRYCGKRISSRYMLTELLTGAAFAGIALRFGLSVESVRLMGLTVLLLGLSLVDLETYEIPNGFIISGILWWVFTCPFSVFLEGNSAFSMMKNALLGSVVIAGAILAITLLFERFAQKEAMGGGDIKLYFMVGLYMNLPLALLNVILSCVIGLLFVAGLKKSKIPFGPSIAIASYLTLLFGSFAVNWYLGLLGI